MALDDGSVEFIVLFAKSTDFRLVLMVDALLYRFLDIPFVNGGLKAGLFVLPLLALRQRSSQAVRVSVKALLFRVNVKFKFLILQLLC